MSEDRRLDERFALLDRVEAPDLWERIETFERPPERPRPARERRVAVAVGLAVAAAAVVLVIWAFSNAKPAQHPRPGSTATVANGEVWFVRGGGEGGTWIESVNPDGSGRRILSSDPAAGGSDDVGASYAWSPKGDRVAFVDATRPIGDVPTGSSWDVYTANPDGSDRTQVTDDGGFDGSPAWSPDGSRLAFASDASDPDRPACLQDASCHRDVFVSNADGTGRRRLTIEPGNEWQPNWGPDGRIVYVSDQADPAGDLYVMNPDGGGVVRLTSTTQAESQPRWSPDGAEIAFVRTDGDEAALFVMNADGSSPRPLATGLPVSHSVDPDILSDFAWSPDSSMIAFVSGGDEAPTLSVVNRDGTGLRVLVEDPQYGVSNPAWRPVHTQNGGVVLSMPPLCPMGIERDHRVPASELGRVVRGHVPAALPHGFRLARVFEMGPDGVDGGRAEWFDGTCRSVSVTFSVGVRLVDLPSDPLLVGGRWLVQYDMADSCGNSVMGMGRCIGYLAQVGNDQIYVQAIGLTRDEADAVVLSIPLQ